MTTEPGASPRYDGMVYCINRRQRRAVSCSRVVSKGVRREPECKGVAQRNTSHGRHIMCSEVQVQRGASAEKVATTARGAGTTAKGGAGSHTTHRHVTPPPPSAGQHPQHTPRITYTRPLGTATSQLPRSNVPYQGARQAGWLYRCSPSCHESTARSRHGRSEEEAPIIACTWHSRTARQPPP